MLEKIVIKILAENHTFDNSNSKSTVFKKFTTVNSKISTKKISAKETTNFT